MAWRVMALAAVAATLAGSCVAEGATATDTGPYTVDGRLPPARLTSRFQALARDHGWQEDVIPANPADAADSANPGRAIRAWRTTQQGPALWLLAGIHGEEPAGPNAIAASINVIAGLAKTGVPMVVIPLCNPVAYARNWRYPNTPDRDWRGGGYSVGDASYLLPDLATGTRATGRRAGRAGDRGADSVRIARHRAISAAAGARPA